MRVVAIPLNLIQFPRRRSASSSSSSYSPLRSSSKLSNHHHHHHHHHHHLLHSQPPPDMEVEVKLRLPDSTSHQSLSRLLAPFHRHTLLQENLFFDTPTSALATARAALRLRFYDLPSAAVLSLKSKPKLEAGISRIEEQEEPIDPQLARSYVADPAQMLGLSSEIIRRVREEFGAKELVCLGGFKNVRGVYHWRGLKLELDETIYEFGVSYEMECETSEPERDKELLEALLNNNGIEFQYSQLNKFQVFLSRKLPE